MSAEFKLPIPGTYPQVFIIAGELKAIKELIDL
jgi:hypothetical protein